MVKVLKEKSSTGSLAISIIAVVISVIALCFTYSDSYLSHRAYVAPSSWVLADDGTRLQIRLFNAGQTPATDLSVTGALSINGDLQGAKDLLSGSHVSVLQNIAAENLPVIIFILSHNELERLEQSQSNLAVLNIKYHDYLGRNRFTMADFVLASPASGKFQPQEIRLEIK